MKNNNGRTQSYAVSMQSVCEKNDIQILSVSRSVVPATGHGIPLGDSVIPAGFPSPADDFHETFDIASHIVRYPAATFFMRVAGNSMSGAGIFDGDLVVVDRSLEAESGDIVVAVLNGEFTIKRFRRNGSTVELVPENPKYRKITLHEGMELEIWGVVTGTYKSFR
jgi:DNA polymerase V